MALCVDILPSSCCGSLKVLTSSSFTTEVITSVVLQITAPGFTVPVSIATTLNTVASYTPVQLGFDAEVLILPEGAYSITITALVDGVSQSFSKKVLHSCSTMNCYYDLLCKLKLSCDGCLDESQTKDLSHIKMFIDAAKAKVEYCDAVDQGMKMFEYAKSLIKKYERGVCLTC